MDISNHFLKHFDQLVTGSTLTQLISKFIPKHNARKHLPLLIVILTISLFINKIWNQFASIFITLITILFCSSATTAPL